MDKDLYAVLGLRPDAETDLIKKTYRKLVQENHPDRLQDRSEAERSAANERMLEITEAFRVLGNSAERAAYDKRRAESRVQAMTQTAGSAEAQASPTAARSSAATKADARIKLSKDVASDFLKKLVQQLLAKGPGVQWKEDPKPPREWQRVLRSDEFGTSYWLFTYQVREASASFARQFVRNIENQVKNQKSYFRNDFFIFVLAFEKMHSPNEVMAALNTFERQGKSGPLTNWRATIVLVDAANMRSAYVGRPIPIESLGRTFRVLEGKWS